MGTHTHGMSNTYFYITWKTMRYRCSNPNKKDYRWYGAKGIKVCDRWQVFENFMDDMYESYQEHRAAHLNERTTIDRIDVKGDYEPGNCRWLTQSLNNLNKFDWGRGISFEKQRNLWIVQKYKNRKRVVKKYFKTYEDAKAFVDEYVKQKVVS